MKTALNIVSLFLLLFLFACSPKIDYHQIATYQDYSVPEIKVAVNDTTKVLLIFPHADDETIAGGLIAYFREHGATIHLLTLCGHNETRIRELSCSAAKLGIQKVEIAGFINNSWDAIMQDSIVFWYDHKDSIKQVIRTKINAFNPQYVVSYDAEIGGYGHPEHRISAELTEQIVKEDGAKQGDSPKMIFQITLTEQLERFLVSKTPGYEFSKKLTGSKGLPRPDIAVDLEKYWDIKNEAAQCHQSQLKILQRFYIVYPEKSKEMHIKAFSREYYSIVKG